MASIIRKIMLTTAICIFASAAHADFSASKQWFQNLSSDERTLLQSQLILTGEYSAIVDGDFGPATYSALTSFQLRYGESQSGVLSPSARAALSERAAEAFALFGMEMVDDRRGRVALLAPLGLLTETEPTRRGTAYFDIDNLVRLETIHKPYSDESYESLYRTLSFESARRQITYQTFNPQRFVVSGKREGLHFYIYMHATPTGTTGFSLEWHPEFQSLASTVAIFTASHSFPIEESAVSASVPPPVASSDAPPRLGYGTGFFVAASGVLVTNHHVIDGCTEISVSPYGLATVITSDETLDLAVLRLISPTPHGVAPLRTETVSLGEDVTIVGYPLPDMMASSVSVGTGIVSSLSGLGGDTRWFTTDVGMQPGNSGGPILDEYGQVVGVAVARLNDAALLASTGVVAPNFGFAIKSSEVLQYLDIFRLPESVKLDQPLTVRETAVVAQTFTAQVRCSL